jgi:hypothetical protein
MVLPVGRSVVVGGSTEPCTLSTVRSLVPTVPSSLRGCSAIRGLPGPRFSAWSNTARAFMAVFTSSELVR